MNSSPPEPDDRPTLALNLSDERVSAGDRLTQSAEQSWLEEVALQLENNPDECWQAIESLAHVELEVRLSIIDELSALGPRPGAAKLLRLLSSTRDPATRSAAQSALERIVWHADSLPKLTASSTLAEVTSGTGGEKALGYGQPFLALAGRNGSGPRLARCLVTPVDGRGRATIVVSVNKLHQRRTAAFLCDVERGIRDVVGEVEPESDRAGGLIDAFDQQPAGDCARDVPELALLLLAGSLMLTDVNNATHAVREWLLGTLGPDFRPAELPTVISDLNASSIEHEEMPQRALSILEACPSWLDVSPLTFELAREIWLREGRDAADPTRDAGAYRYLFEHRLSRRLELYGRMLLWMAWLWKYSGLADLSLSAATMAAQLSDEQYAVPSHPFTVELTTRSLLAAQARMRTADDPRKEHRA
jgi:hypothetical protein